ncbi:uncharacterized protein LOC123195812 isoform X3 [Mangifera indica]|uniref:uncharacterized protein LOC123195812 isoform X3 n=1 Tax=Mangifera indica TaxID=29780 RepID=UPI001CFAABF4|nr:uncharacterized protein LOC123195812 isoform X3 [Mangifera indica]
MPFHGEDDGEEFSGSENDDGFDEEEREAIRRACMISGTDPNDLDNTNKLQLTVAADSSGGVSADYWSSDSEDDRELVRKIQNRLALSDDSCQPLCALPPVLLDDDEEDDFETLRAIQLRFSAYNSADTTKGSWKDSLQTPNQILKKLVTTTIYRRSMWRHCLLVPLSGNSQKNIICLCCHKIILTSQNLLRCLLMPLRRIGRIRILSEVSCRRITGRALSQKKDPRVQLISSQKLRNGNDSEVFDKKSSAIHYGPSENSHVSNYRMALSRYPLSLHRKKWSKTEKENLGKGIRQQFQEMLLQVSMDRLSGSEGSSMDTNGLDNIFASIKDLDVTPELIREFLPKVNWNQLASMYVKGRSGGECEAQWLNFEDPCINHNPWTIEEDKKLLLIIQEKGISNWFDISVSLGTNRIPFQCLARYQRSLNASILKREWIEDEDEQLCMAVEAFGESNWQSVASTLKGRTGPQCSNRWKKTLHPMRQRVGKWTPDEDKRLTVAAILFGPKNWKKIAQFVPGRTQVQCRERWVNSLDPSVNRGEWTEEEDLMLEDAIKKHGFSWSKVAAALPARTDNQCWRRWKYLHPDEVHVLQARRKMQKAALMSNFVDRERERPALGPNDFMPLALTNPASEHGDVIASQKHERKSRRKAESGNKEDAAPCENQKTRKSQRTRKKTQICSEVLEITYGDDTETSNQRGVILKKKIVKLHSGKKKVNSEPNTVKKVSKRCSKMPSCAELDEMSILLPPPESVEAEITFTDSSNTPCGNTNVSNCDSIDPIWNSAGNLCSISCQEQDAPYCSEVGILRGTIDDIELLQNHSDYLDSTLSTTINSEDGDLLGGIDASTKKRPSKLLPKKKSGMKSGKERTEGENISLESVCETVKRNNKRKICNEPSGKRQDVASISCEQAGSKTLLETSDGEDITLECFLCNKSKKRKLKAGSSSESLLLSKPVDQHISEGKICNEPSGEFQDVASISCEQDGSKQCLETSVGEDITLACFLRNKLKKRKLKAGSSSKSLVSKLVNQHINEDHMPAHLQNGEAETTNGSSDEPVTKLKSINLEGDGEVGEII